jgi:hypothetical protein
MTATTLYTAKPLKIELNIKDYEDLVERALAGSKKAEKLLMSDRIVIIEQEDVSDTVACNVVTGVTDELT